jgi:hypothetical protein
MRILAAFLPMLALVASLACAKPPATPPDQGGGSTCDFTADPDKSYIGHSPEQCATIRFVCEEGTEYFADECGCGCVVVGDEG